MGPETLPNNVCDETLAANVCPKWPGSLATIQHSNIALRVCMAFVGRCDQS